jgi:hypothetical protein
LFLIVFGCPKSNQEILKPWIPFMTIFEFIGNFFFQKYVFTLQAVFSELEIKVFLERGLESF